MEQSIKEYADALYIRALAEAREKHKVEITEANRQMAQRGMSQGFSGIAFGKTIEMDAALIGRQMKARLVSFQEAFEHAGATPSQDELQEIWKAAEDAYESGIQRMGNSIRERTHRAGSPHTFGADNVRSAVAHHHDDVLGDWNVWRRRVALGAPRQQSFSATEVKAINDLPKKDELLADLNRLLLLAGQIGVIFIDLDNFKTVNDTMGHDAGDKCLEEVAQVIGSVVLHKGRLYRYASGDEFMVILPNVDESEAAATAERIRKAIEFQNVGGAVKVTASIGVIVAAEKVYASAEEILKTTDDAMYKSKQKKNAVSLAARG
ncbi:MAG TPA: GGDEF domain-containing protein [Candidatus Acidoferrum sp.]|nr:GGDEF domain-containing protein [Candidatus Acidoferrum sp.]